MAYRFATENQITQVEGWLEQIQAYQAVFGGLMVSIAGFIEAYEQLFFDEYSSVYNAPMAGIETRYITGEGRDDERWRGHLLSASPGGRIANVWCLTVTMNQGIPFEQDEGMGSFDKPYSIAVDYFFDWDFGKDSFTDEDDNYIIGNSEEFFNKKVEGFDFILEQCRTCLPNNAELLSWIFRRGIKRFTNASTHWLKGDLALKIQGL